MLRTRLFTRSELMLHKFFASCLVSLMLTACAGRIDRGTPFSNSARYVSVAASPSPYVWARNDGQRMAGNPALLRQGQKDQAHCRDEAATSGALNHNVFAQCMQRRGYSARLAS